MASCRTSPLDLLQSVPLHENPWLLKMSLRVDLSSRQTRFAALNKPKDSLSTPPLPHVLCPGPARPDERANFTVLYVVLVCPSLLDALDQQCIIPNSPKWILFLVLRQGSDSPRFFTVPQPPLIRRTASIRQHNRTSENRESLVLGRNVHVPNDADDAPMRRRPEREKCLKLCRSCNQTVQVRRPFLVKPLQNPQKCTPLLVQVSTLSKG